MITIQDTPKVADKPAETNGNDYKWRGGCTITKSVDGEDRIYRARYTAKCPRCKKKVEIGHRIREHSSNGKRVRWAHYDCEDPIRDALPALNGSAPVNDAKLKELTSHVASLQYAVDILKKRMPREVVIRKPDGTTKPVKGCVHPVFGSVMQMASARKPIFLPGPSGSGKSHLAQQVAESMELSFASISCSAGMSESQLLGRMVPIGDHGQFEFLTTPFLEAYEKGGVFLFDEIDAADSNVLLVINSALANGHLSVPSRHDKPVAKKHEDFVCIAAANTFGNGADRQYVGRNQLDAATLDRFRIGTIVMDYDRVLEAQLCPNEELRERIWSYRVRVASNRLQRIVSMRFLIDAYDMVSKFGWTFEQVDAQLFAGWRDDEITKVKS